MVGSENNKKKWGDSFWYLMVINCNQGWRVNQACQANTQLQFFLPKTISGFVWKNHLFSSCVFGLLPVKMSSKLTYNKKRKIKDIKLREIRGQLCWLKHIVAVGRSGICFDFLYPIILIPPTATGIMGISIRSVNSHDCITVDMCVIL